MATVHIHLKNWRSGRKRRNLRQWFMSYVKPIKRLQEIFLLKIKLKEQHFLFQIILRKDLNTTTITTSLSFLRIAKGSCGEVRNCLLFSLKVKYTTQEEVNHMIVFARLLGKQIGSMIQYLIKIKAANSANNKNT